VIHLIFILSFHIPHSRDIHRPPKRHNRCN